MQGPCLLFSVRFGASGRQPCNFCVSQGTGPLQNLHTLPMPVAHIARIVLFAVAAWGACIALAGLVGSIWPAALLFALAGAADSVSAVCRSTISQTLTPDRMRGRMSSVFSLVVAAGPRLGDVESGTVAALTSPAFSVVSGGLACLASVGVIAAAFPQLAAYDGDEVGAGAVGVDLELEAEKLEATELSGP